MASKPKLIVLLVEGHAGDRVFVALVQESVGVTDEVRVVNLAISTTSEARFKSTRGLYCPYGVIMKEAPFYRGNVSIVAAVVPDAFPLSQIPQLQFVIGASTEA